jgi:hypothetical protein
VGGSGGPAGRAGVKFLFSDKVIIAATQSFDGDRNFALAGFETTPGPTSDSGSCGRDRHVEVHPAQPAFPNPLVRQSVFAFDLPRAEGARIGIYDVAGHLVRMLANNDFPAGRNRATWDGTDAYGNRVAAGVYYAQLDVGTVRSHRPVVVVR